MKINITFLDLGQIISNPTSPSLPLYFRALPSLAWESGDPGPEVWRLNVTTVNESVVDSSIKKPYLLTWFHLFS